MKCLLFQYEFPHIETRKVTEIRITLPHLESVTPPSDDTKLELNINDAGSILHADGEIFPISDSRITLRYV